MPVAVEGLDDLVRAFQRVDAKVPREMRKQLRNEVGRPFVADAKEHVGSVGLVKTGKLRRSIRPLVQGSTLLVRDSATNKGFPYPAVYEFGKGGARAFLGPTADEWIQSGKLEKHMEGFMEWVETEWDA